MKFSATRYTTASLARALAHHVERGALHSVSHFDTPLPGNKRWRVNYSLGVIDLTNRECWALVIGLAGSATLPYDQTLPYVRQARAADLMGIAERAS